MIPFQLHFMTAAYSDGSTAESPPSSVVASIKCCCFRMHHPWFCDWECGSFGIRIQVKNKAPSQMERSRRLNLSTQGEDHVDCGLHLDGFVVEQVRPVTPGLDRIERRLLQHGGAGDDVKVLNGPGLGNRGLDDDGSGDARCFSNRRINRRGLLDQHALRNTGGDVDLLWRSRLHLRCVSRAKDASDDAAGAAAETLGTRHAECARRGFFLGNLLDILRNLGRSDQLIVHHLRLNVNNLYNLWRRRRRWWWRRRWRRDEKGLHHRLGQRLWVDQRDKDHRDQ